MQTPISLQIYFFLNFVFMIHQNMIICTVGVHYPYLAKFAGCNKINIFKRLLTRFTYLRSYLKVRKWFQPCFTPENYHINHNLCWYYSHQCVDIRLLLVDVRKKLENCDDNCDRLENA